MAEFNPEGVYTWQPTEKLEVLGKEFEILHNTLSGAFQGSIPTGELFLMLYECFKLTSDILKRNVENGKIQESKSPN